MSVNSIKQTKLLDHGSSELWLFLLDKGSETVRSISCDSQLICEECWGVQLRMIGVRKSMLVMYVDLIDRVCMQFRDGTRHLREQTMRFLML